MRETGMKILTMLAFALTLVACGSDEPEEREPTIGTEIAEDYNEAMEKAREVENQVMEQKEKIDAALKEAENAIDE
jgi:hypothetical protein